MLGAPRPVAVAALLLLVGASAGGAGKSRKEYRERLLAARAIADGGDLAAALRAYDRCVELAPDDGNLRLEMARVALHAKDLDRAAAEAQHGADSYYTLDARAAALYVLGRVAEQRGDAHAAVDLYRRSLAVRFDSIVRARLAWLDHAAELEVDPLSPAPLDGPFESVDAWCGAVTANGQECRACGQIARQSAIRGSASGAFRSALLFTSACGAPPAEELHVAVRLGDGWYVGTAAPLGGGRCAWDAPSLPPIAAGGPAGAILTVRFTTRGACHTLAEDREQVDSYTALVGVGPSGRPSITPSIVTEGHVTIEVPAKRRRDRVQRADVYLELVPATDADGALDLKGGATGPYRDDNGLIGRHVLKFW
jgi:hypothetical protein